MEILRVMLSSFPRLCLSFTSSTSIKRKFIILLNAINIINIIIDVTRNILVIAMNLTRKNTIIIYTPISTIFFLFMIIIIVIIIISGSIGIVKISMTAVSSRCLLGSIGCLSKHSPEAIQIRPVRTQPLSVTQPTVELKLQEQQ